MMKYHSRRSTLHSRSVGSSSLLRSPIDILLTSFAVNRQIKQYSATVYSLSAQRHVEAQLDALYTELVSSGANPLKGEIVLPKGFKEDGIGIEDLPEGEDLGDESIQEEYDALREKLLRLKKTVGEVRKKREALRVLRERLEVLQGSSEGVQKELVGVRSGWDEEMKETRAKVLEVRRWVADVEDEGAREDDVKRDIRDVALDLVK